MFWSDLRWSFRSWSSRPEFVVLTAVLLLLVRWSLAVAPSLYWVGYLILVAFSATQRIFYLRFWKARDFSIREVPKLTWSLAGRFYRLLAIVGVPILLLMGIIVGVEGAVKTTSHNAKDVLPLRVYVSWLVVFFLVDTLLTFVTPALVYSTRSAKESLKLGFKFLRNTWPNSAWYVLTPGLTISAIALAIPKSDGGSVVGVVIFVASGLVAFGFRGAVVPYYLRLVYAVGEDGAV